MSIFDERQAWADETEVEYSKEEFSAWLKMQSFETWHEVALGWNWDDGSDELLWIVAQPDCDMGTACYVFFVAADNWVEYPTADSLPYESYKQSWRACKKIAERWNKNDLKNAMLFPYRSYEGSVSEYLTSKEYYLKMSTEFSGQGGQLPWAVPSWVYEYKGERKSASEFEFEGRCKYKKFEKWRSRQI